MIIKDKVLLKENNNMNLDEIPYIDSEINYAILLFLVTTIIIMTIIYGWYGNNRAFNFDEFQVMYEGASILKGKRLYTDKIGNHFPLVSIIISQFIKIIGVKTNTILLARYFILFLNVITLIYIYKILKIISAKIVGLFACLLILLSPIFLDKGIEIRHDIFNTLFNIIGGYYAILYIKREKFRYLILSSLFCGFALACTQKAIIWSFGIIIGLFLIKIKNENTLRTLKYIMGYIVIMITPILLSVLYLIVFNRENITVFVNNAIINAGIAYLTFTKELYPFPYPKKKILLDLFLQNPGFYVFYIISLIFFIYKFFYKNKKENLIIVLWSLTGLVFYLIIKRPFKQTFLPTIPVISIIISSFIYDLRTKYWKADNKYYKLIYVTIIILITLWPFFILYNRIKQLEPMKNQIDNLNYCISNLKPQDKVFSLELNQIFFEPVLSINNQDCGRIFQLWNSECFKKKMIEAQCKVIIYGYRETLLNKEIKNMIFNHYIYTKTGFILIPGFRLKPNKRTIQDIWIKGYYYTPTKSILINGKPIDNNIVFFNIGNYEIENKSNRIVTFVFLFHPKKIQEILRSRK